MEKNVADPVQKLTLLAQADLDAVATYNWALPLIDTPEFAQQLAVLKEHHERRAHDLCEVIRRFGGPEPCLDTSEPMPEPSTPGQTADTLVALEAIQDVEEKAENIYLEAQSWSELPHDVRAMLTVYEQDEKQDLTRIEKAMVSIRAAAKLLGPENSPPILHH